MNDLIRFWVLYLKGIFAQRINEKLAIKFRHVVISCERIELVECVLGTICSMEILRPKYESLNELVSGEGVFCLNLHWTQAKKISYHKQ